MGYVFDNEDCIYYGARADYPTSLDFTRAIEEQIGPGDDHIGWPKGYTPEMAAPHATIVWFRQSADDEEVLEFVKEGDEGAVAHWQLDADCLPATVTP